MAQTATLYDFQIGLSNVDRSIEQQLSFKVARHPSETMERLWLRVLAYCWLWEERLVFGAGLSDPDAPDLEERDYTGQVKQWVRVGKGDPAKIQRAVDQNSGAQVAVLFEGPERMAAFLEEAARVGAKRAGQAKLAAVEEALLSALGSDDSRRNKAIITLVGDQFYIDVNGKTFEGALLHGRLPD